MVQQKRGDLSIITIRNRSQRQEMQMRENGGAISQNRS